MSLRRIERPAIEFNVAEHCNLRCAGCDHASPFLPPKLAVLAEFERDLGALATVLHARELKLLGGEPLLHPQLPQFAAAARRIGIADRIWVVTNGLLLPRVDPELYRVIDGLRVSRYPGVRPTVGDDELQRLAAEHRFALEILPVAEFRATLREHPHAEAVTTAEVYRRCDLAHRWSCHTVHAGRYYKCPPAALLGARRPRLGIGAPDGSRDGVALHDNPDLRGALVAYLAERTPLQACAFCAGSCGPSFAHRQLRADEIARGGEPDAEPRLGNGSALARVVRAVGHRVRPSRS